MFRLIVFLLLSSAVFAQTEAPPAENAPDDVHRALVARVTEFYALLKSQQYRKAEAFIAEDTKDYYYDGAKPVIDAFEVMDIEFSDNFTHAKAMTKVSEPVVMAGFPPGEMTVRMPTLWRLENGNWLLYEDLSKMASPGGIQTKVKAAVDAGTVAAVAEGFTPDKMPKELPKTPDFAMGKITVDKGEVQISPGTAEQIHLTNGSAGPMDLELGAQLRGIEAKLDKTTVAKGEQAVLTLSAGKEPFGGIFFLRIMPTGENIPIRVQVKH